MLAFRFLDECAQEIYPDSRSTERGQTNCRLVLLEKRQKEFMAASCFAQELEERAAEMRLALVEGRLRCACACLFNSENFLKEAIAKLPEIGDVR